MQKIKSIARSRCKQKEPGYSGLTSLISSYKASARARGLDFTLTRERVKDITKQNCYYCGAVPAGISYCRNTKSKEHSAYIYNGMDRQDNNLGYVEGNCVPCCWTCNNMKSKFNTKEFIEHIRLITERHKDD
jgi:hypothetical protein